MINNLNTTETESSEIEVLTSDEIDQVAGGVGHIRTF